MPTADVHFGLLKGWIKNFKQKQGRDPFFEDFPDDIGNVLYGRHGPAAPV